jgi:hypothetical protein
LVEKVLFESSPPQQSVAVNLLDEFLTHWNSIPRDGLVPHLSDYLDRLNVKIQPWTIIADMTADKMPIRLFGTGIAEVMGRDFTGVDYLLAIEEKSRRHVLERDRQCTTQPCGLRLDLTATTLSARSFDYKVMVLPVRRAGNGLSLILITSMEQARDWRELPAAVMTCEQVTWIDIGAGVPAQAPWSDPRYCS